MYRCNVQRWQPDGIKGQPVSRRNPSVLTGLRGNLRSSADAKGAFPRLLPLKKDVSRVGGNKTSAGKCVGARRGYCVDG